MNEIEYIPWISAIGRFDYYIDMLDATEIFGEFTSYLITLIEKIYFKLTWNVNPNDTWLEK